MGFERSGNYVVKIILTFIILILSALPAVAAIVMPAQPEFIGPRLVALETAPLVDKLQMGSIGDVSFNHPESIYQFYRDRNFESFWTNGDRASSRARDAINILIDSESHGLNPDNYASSFLKSLSQNTLENPLDFELIMSEAIIRYGQDMTGIRIKPKVIGADTRSWRGMDAYDILKFIEELGDVEEGLEQLAPQSPLYKRLKSELKKTKAEFEKQISPLSTKKFPGLLKVGQSHPVIADIRDMLNVEAKDNPALFDPELELAVKEFQSQSGIKPDGLVGIRTFTALQRGPQQKLMQIVATMERIRWLPREITPRHIEVNIPRQVVELFKEGDVYATIPVVIGRPERQTQDFITHITGIRFNPSWHVPPTIKSEDILPALQKSKNALKEKNLELVRYTSDGAQKIDPQSIDWAAVTPEQMKQFGMVQDPGDKNPLGRIRVLMPNQYDIYLHDTNTPELFSKDYRALSSGCVRVADPKKLANFILDGREGWSEERMNEILSTTKTKEITANNIPVYLTYQSIWQEAGRLIIGPDVYDSDVKLFNALAIAQKLPQSIQSLTVKAQ